MIRFPKRLPHVCPRPICVTYRIATNPNACAADLLETALTHPAETLAHPAFDLLMLEDPTVMMRVRIDALESQLSQRAHPLSQFSVNQLIAWNLQVTREALPFFRDVEPRPGLPFAAAQALDVAANFLEGKANRKSLAIGHRFAQSFVEATPGWKGRFMNPRVPPTAAEQAAIDRIKKRNALATLCAGTCNYNRTELLDSLWFALHLMRDEEGRFAYMHALLDNVTKPKRPKLAKKKGLLC